MVNSSTETGTSLAETVLLTGLGLLLVIYGVTRWIDMFTYILPAIVYVMIGIILLLWGVSLNRRS